MRVAIVDMSKYKPCKGQEVDTEPCELFDDKGYESLADRVLSLLQQGQRLEQARRGELYDCPDDFEGDPADLENEFDEADDFEKVDLAKSQIKKEYVNELKRHQMKMARTNEALPKEDKPIKSDDEKKEAP